MLIEYLSKSLVLTPDFIKEIADTANERYNKFSIPKKMVELESYTNHRKS
jgi:RNA-directed DNA polymerase